MGTSIRLSPGVLSDLRHAAVEEGRVIRPPPTCGSGRDRHPPPPIWNAPHSMRHAGGRVDPRRAAPIGIAGRVPLMPGAAEDPRMPRASGVSDCAFIAI